MTATEINSALAEIGNILVQFVLEQEAEEKETASDDTLESSSDAANEVQEKSNPLEIIRDE